LVSEVGKVGKGPGVKPKDEAQIEDGYVQVPLRGRIDIVGLSRDLQEKGYYLANDPWDIDSQGWGSDHDLDGYYPYWVFRDGEQWIFAFPPEDYQKGAGEGKDPVVGEKAREEIKRWVPYLEGWCH